jgi:small nuclear ribonucleoprotein (snRNP)-like protein
MANFANFEFDLNERPVRIKLRGGKVFLGDLSFDAEACLEIERRLG